MMKFSMFGFSIYDFENFFVSSEQFEYIGLYKEEMSKENWIDISKSDKLNKDLIEKYQDKLSWKDILENKYLYEYDIKKISKKYKDKINYNVVQNIKKSKKKIKNQETKSQVLTEEYINKHIDEIDWYDVSKNQVLSEEFIDKYSNKLDWGLISGYQKLSEEFIIKYSYKFDLEMIFLYQNVSEEFIEKYCYDKLEWEAVSQNQVLSEEFIENHINEIDLDFIFGNQNISIKFINKYVNKNNEEYLLKNKNIDQNILLDLYKGKNKEEYILGHFNIDFIEFIINLRKIKIEVREEKYKDYSYEKLKNKLNTITIN